MIVSVRQSFVVSDAGGTDVVSADAATATASAAAIAARAAVAFLISCR